MEDQREQQEQKFQEMTQAPVGRLVGRLAFPCIISMLVTAFYNMADTFFVGMMDSNAATGAVGVVFSMMAIIQAVGFFFGHGSGNFISRELGKHNLEEASNMAATGFFSALAAGALICLAGQIFLSQLASLLGATPTILPYANAYLRVILLGAPWMTASLVLNNQLRFQGSAAYAMVGITSGAVLNIGLDPLLIFGFHLEVAGAAIATAVSNAASVAFFAAQYARLGERTNVSLHPRDISFRFVRPIFSVGLASALATALGNASNMVMVHLASGYGDIPVAAYGIVKRIDQFPLNVSMGLCQGFMPLVGYTFAAKNYRRMRSVSVFSWTAALALSACFVACFAAFAPQILRLFIPEAETSALGARSSACTA